MKTSALLLSVLALSACSLVSPYTITFTTPEATVVDPATDTLDFVVSAPTLAYISGVDCEGAEDLELLPVVKDDMEAKTAHNLPLTVLNGAAGSECDVTVSVFDQTTTSTATKSIELVVAGDAAVEEEDVSEPVEDMEMPVPEETTDGEPVVETEVQLETETTHE